MRVLKTLLIACAAACGLAACLNEDELRPPLGFLPNAQITFADSLWERDLNQGLDVLNGNLQFRVRSETGLSAVRVRLLNGVQASPRVIDTVPVQEFTTFDNANDFAGTCAVRMSGNTIGISIVAIDRNGLRSERLMAVMMQNGKPLPSITWTSKDCWGLAIGSSVDVRMYDDCGKAFAINAQLMSLTNVVGTDTAWSFGLDKVNVYVRYDNGEEVLADSKDFSGKDGCATCRRRYALRIAPEWVRADGSKAVQLRVTATDARYQMQSKSLVVNVHSEYAAPEIIFDDDEVLVSSEATETPAMGYLARSYDSRLYRITYYAVHADGRADSIGSNNGQVNVLDPDKNNGGYSQHTAAVVIKPFTPDIVALRVKADNRKNLVAERDLPIRVVEAPAGVRQAFHVVAFTQASRTANDNYNPTARPCVFSLVAGRMLLDAEVSEANPPAIVFNATSRAQLYPESPHVRTPTGVKWDAWRTKFMKKAVSDFDNATHESLTAMLPELLGAKSYYSTPTADRTASAYTCIAKRVTEVGGVVTVEHSNYTASGLGYDYGMLSLPPDLWDFASITIDEVSRIWSYTGKATRANGAVNKVFAFATQDSIVGIFKYEESFCYAHWPAAAQSAQQRMTVSVKWTDGKASRN